MVQRGSLYISCTIFTIESPLISISLVQLNYIDLTDICIIQLVNSAKNLKPISLHCNDKFTDTALDVI